MARNSWSSRVSLDPRAFELGLVLACAFVAGAAPPARAVRWDTYNNANLLNVARQTPAGVWCASSLGLHRYDPASGAFTRVDKSVGQLASDAIADVAVDGQGSTWFATQEKGVSVFTSQGAWRTLSAFDGLPGDTVTCLTPSALGMWIGTTQGLALFNGFTLTAVWPDGVNPSPFSSNRIRGVAVTGESTYVATNDGVYVTKSSEGVTWSRRTTGLFNLDVKSIAALGTQAWCVSGGVIENGGETGAWAPSILGLGGATGVSLFAKNGVLLAGTTAGVFRWDGVSTWQPVGSLGFPLSAQLDIDDAGDFAAGNADGLWLWNGSTWNLHTSSGPVGNWVQGMQLVGSKLYVSTRDRGLARFDAGAWRSFYPSPGATPDTTFLSPASFFSLLAARDGTLWTGIWGADISRLDDSTEPPHVTHYYGAADGTVPYDVRNSLGWSSTQDAAGNIWIGGDTFSLGVITPIGINVIGTNGSRTNYSPLGGAAMSGPQIRSLTFAPGPLFELWVGYARAGVDVFRDPTLATRFARFSTADNIPNANLSNDDVWAVEFNGDSAWIATSDGLSRYSRATRQRIEVITTSSPSSQGAVHPLSIDASGGVWWATVVGVFHRRTDRTVEVFNADNSPLITNDVHSVFVDRATGDVWIGTVLGLNRYNADAPPAGGNVVVPATFGVYPNPALVSEASLGLCARDLSGPFVGQVYDVRGRVVKQLLGNATSGGLWDGTDANGGAVRPGLYFLKIDSGGKTRVGRVVLVR